MDSNPPTVRLFLALWPPPAIRDRLAGAGDAWRWPEGVSRTRPERLHCTLHFIGDVAASRLEATRDALKVAFEPFELTLDRCEVWRGGIAVLEASQIPPQLLALHARLAEALRSQALPVEERPFRAHVTLARKAQGAQPSTTGLPVQWRVADGYRLVRSLPGGRGYEPVPGCY